MPDMSNGNQETIVNISYVPLPHLLPRRKNVWIVDLDREKKKIIRDNAADAIVHSMIVLFRLQNSDRGIYFSSWFSVFTLARWCVARDWFGDDLKVLVIIWSTSVESRSLGKRSSWKGKCRYMVVDSVRIIRVGKQSHTANRLSIASSFRDLS